MHVDARLVHPYEQGVNACISAEYLRQTTNVAVIKKIEVNFPPPPKLPLCWLVKIGFEAACHGTSAGQTEPMARALGARTP